MKLCVRSLFLLCGFGCCAWAQSPPASWEQQLVAVLAQVREYRQPLLSKRALDFSPPAVAQRRALLEALRSRLGAMPWRTWTVPQQVDYLAVRAQLDALLFEYRRLRPWARDPGLYVDVARDLAFTPLPLRDGARDEFVIRITALPGFLRHGKSQLTEAAGELAKLALFNLENPDGVGHGQPYRSNPPAGVLGWYADLLDRITQHEPALLPHARAAQAAVIDFHAWLQESLPRMRAPAGVDRLAYEWYLRHVHFEPYSADDVLRIGDREYDRAMAALAMEMRRNRSLPALAPAASEAEYKLRLEDADRHVRAFIAATGFMTIPAYVGRLGDNVPWIERAGGRRNFWEEVQYRDPLPDKVHAVIPGHRFDLRLHREDRRPIRGQVQNGSRVEGWGFYLEEAMMNAGLLDHRPRTRELFWIFLAARAVRNRAEIMLHTNQWTVDQAVDFMVKAVPFMDRDVARVDCEIYLRQPTYGQNYLMGKIQIEQLLAERALQLGEKFSLQDFHDQFLAAGLLPVSLIRWEITGRDDQIRRLIP
jgi:hypothetical protein